MPDVTVIALDGPAAAGKGTLARRLAAHFGLRYLDSGRLYRAVAAQLLRAGDAPDDAKKAVAAAQSLTEDDLDAPGLREEAVGQAASVLAPIAAVREVLLAYQRAYAADPPGAVIDGRDIGSVVFPGATHKLFVTASLEERVTRRCAELAARGKPVDRAAVRDEMAARDARDQERGIAPLLAADDAHELDTSELDAEGAFNAALAAIGADR
ncbi:MAG: (d)CMP kinase [Alphaproteobacteria bacterium]